MLSPWQAVSPSGSFRSLHRLAISSYLEKALVSLSSGGGVPVAYVCGEESCLLSKTFDLPMAQVCTKYVNLDKLSSILSLFSCLYEENNATPT